MTELKAMDPNENWGRKTVRLTFMCWDYSKSFEVEVGGNTLGFSLFDVAIGSVYESLPSNNWGSASLVLERADGDTLQCDDEEEDGEDWLGKYLVAAEIIKIAPEREA